MQRAGWQTRTLPVPRSQSLGASRLLLALVLQRQTYPDNISDIGRRLRASRNTARRWRDELVALGLVRRVAGSLELDEKGFSAWRERETELLRQRNVDWHCDGLPWALIRGSRGQRQATHTQLLACAVLTSEALRRTRYIRSDAERARLANVSESTVYEARNVMVARGLVTVEHVRRGKASKLARLMFRPALVEGEPISDVWAAELQRRAQCGQLGIEARRAKGVGNSQATGVGNAHGTPERYAEPEQAKPTPKAAPKVDRQAEANRRAEEQKQKQRLEKVGALLSKAARQTRIGRGMISKDQKQRDRRDIARELMTPTTVAKLASMSGRSACEQVLLAAGAWSQTPGQRRQTCDALVARYRAQAPEILLSVVADVLLDNVSDVGAIVADRCKRLTKGDTISTVRANRRSWPLLRILTAAREHVDAA